MVMSASSPDSASGISRHLAALPALLADIEDMDRLIWKTASLGASAIDRVDACGVTVLREGLPTSIMPDVAPYADLEQLQYETGDGPALAAVDSREPVLVPSMADEPRFGEYPRRAAERGLAASLSLPMINEDDPLGSMTLYSTRSHDFSAGRDLAWLVVDLATTGFSLMLKHAEQAGLAEQLQQALESRSVIDQAKGMVMLRYSCSADQAFSFLREQSQVSNTKLREVANAVVGDPVTWLA